MQKFVAVCLCLVGGVASAQPKKTESAVDNAALAEKIAGKVANVKEGEIVQISGRVEDLALLEEIAVAIRKRGAHPLLTVGSEGLAKKLLSSVPEKYDGQSPALDLALAKIINARITIPTVRDPAIFASLSPVRRAAMAKSGASVRDLDLKRNVRLIDLDNDLAPSPARAKDLGIPEADLAKIYMDGLTADYSAIETKGKELKALLTKGGELHVTHANGTDFKVKLKGRKILASDGVISDEDVKAGGASVNVWLPAGEVYFTPVPGSLVGKIVDDRLIIDGKEILGLTLEVKAGKITALSAKSGWDAVKANYDAAGPGKTEISVFDIGINPAVKTTAKFESFVSAGTVTIFTGANVWAGGSNKEPYSIHMFLPGTTVMLDGKPLIENGALK